MSFLLRWLRIEKQVRVALQPSRAVEINSPYDDVFDACVAGIERVLGGVIRESDRVAGVIEATFGLTFSERLTCRLERIDATRTRARIESRRGAAATARTGSAYVDRLAEHLLESADKPTE